MIATWVISLLALLLAPILLIRFRKRWVAAFNLAITNRITSRFAARLPGFGILTHVGRKSGRLYHTPVIESKFASALEQGFRSAGWKGALTKGIEVRQAQRRTGYSSAYGIAQLYADLRDNNQAFQWLNTSYHERDAGLA